MTKEFWLLGQNILKIAGTVLGLVSNLVTVYVFSLSLVSWGVIMNTAVITEVVLLVGCGLALREVTANK